jgi:DNA-directed RNA polymerase specialized sigma subunit
VITLYYYEGLTLAEFGQVLGVTESRVARCTPRRSCSSGRTMQDAR